MNEDVISDFKQFITTTVSQQTTEIVERLDRIDNRLDRADTRFDRLEHKVDDISSSIAEAIESTNVITDKLFKNHEKRITKLERKAV